MKYALVAAALAVAVHAQTIEDVPECAIPCLDDAIGSETDCATDDYPCVCENFEAIQGVATSCVIEECGPEVALNEVLPAVEALCENAGEDGGDGDDEETTSAAETTASVTETVTEEPTAEPTSDLTTIETTLTLTTATEPGTPTHHPTNGTIPEPTGEPEPIPTGGAAAVVPGLALAGLAVLAL